MLKSGFRFRTRKITRNHRLRDEYIGLRQTFVSSTCSPQRNGSTIEDPLQLTTPFQLEGALVTVSSR
ncbi:hypothetical protein BDN72DRAFT_286464 [Pluteus cervinus]|uniref:Uncharacterized protein n=1 Tax=Pluteus cervinus TaxID=181527 RepID=A0ACD3AEL2_9AGAR|nr:hypothetical protein BDN72DRAFT_286464 [Pluteus cervinus]